MDDLGQQGAPPEADSQVDPLAADRFAWQRRIDEWRKDQVMLTRHLSDASLPNVVGRLGSSLHEDALAAEEIVLLRESRDLLEQCVEELGEDQRAPLRWMYVDGLTVRQIADRTGQSVRTVERRLQDARTSLRGKLERSGFEHPERGLAAISAGALLRFGPLGAAELRGSAVAGASASLFGAFGALVWAGIAAGIALVLLLRSSGSEAQAGASPANAAFAPQPDTPVPLEPEGNGADPVDALADTGLGRTAVPGPPGGTPQDVSLSAPAPSQEPVALELRLTVNGSPGEGFAPALNWTDPDTGRSEWSTDGSLLVEEAPGRYVLRGDWVGREVKVELEHPSKLFHVHARRLLGQAAEVVDAVCDVAPRGFAVPLALGTDYDPNANPFTGPLLCGAVLTEGNALWFVGHPREDFRVVSDPNDFRARVLSPTYDGELHYPMAPAGDSVEIRFRQGRGDPDSWRLQASTEVPFRD